MGRRAQVERCKLKVAGGSLPAVQLLANSKNGRRKYPLNGLEVEVGELCPLRALYVEVDKCRRFKRHEVLL